MKRLTIILSLLAIFSMFTVAVAPAAEPEVVYERNETLYTGGTQWGPPSSWNPMVTWG